MNVTITDKRNQTRVRVARERPDFRAILVNVTPSTDNFPQFTFFIDVEQAAELAHALLAAIHGEDGSQVELRATMETYEGAGKCR